LGVTTSASGTRARAQRLDRVGREQAIARCRDHHGVEHDPALVVARKSGRNGFDDPGISEHADLHPRRRRDRRTPRPSARVTKAGGTSRTALTPFVFCAVSAAITEAP